MSFNDIISNPYYKDYPVHTNQQRGYGHHNAQRKYNNISNNANDNMNDNMNDDNMNDSINDNMNDSMNDDSMNDNVKDIDDIGLKFKTLDDIKEHEDENRISELKTQILRTLGYIHKTAKVTQKELDSQGDIISDLQPKLEHIENNLDRADTAVDILKNRFNKFAFWRGWKFRKSDNVILPSQTKRDNEINELNETNKEHMDKYNDMKDELATKSSTSGFLGLLWSDRNKDKSEDFCDTLTDHIRKIKKQNEDIGHELDAQNKSLKQMTKKIDNSNKQIDNVNRDINRLTK